MRILVTGGAGFIGSNFIHYILKTYPKYKIVNYDKLTYAGNLDNLREADLNPNYKFIKGDILDQKRVEDVIKSFNVSHIVHFAAESHVDRSIMGPKIFVKTNVLGTQVLLDAALKHGIKRFHHVSTDEVYGSLALGSEEKFDEKTAYNPRSPYSASKAASDHLVNSYFYTYDLFTTTTNASNNYGPFQHTEKFIPRMITNLIDSEKLPIYGDGKNVRDWIYVEDHCRAIDAVLKKGEPGKTYLVGGMTEDVDNIQVANKLLDIFGKKESSIKFVKDRKGHDRRYAVDWKNTKDKLGWKPKYSFGKWLVKTVEWYRENEWWWRPQKKKAEELYKKTGQC